MAKNKNKKKTTSQNSNSSSSSSKDILSTLDDFTSKENWDKFFTLRGTDNSFEWYAEWSQLKPPLLSLLTAAGAPDPPNLQVLVPGCGNSRLSEHLYDAGFHDITNVDFSKVVISDMLRRNVRDRPRMRWRVMDITDMQFADAAFDIVLDKGGLDALMEPEFGPKLGNQYLSEVKRVLKPGGKFMCLTLAESHVLGLLFPKFRFGWEVTLHCIPFKPSSKPSLNTFMVVAVKGDSCLVDPIVSSFDHSSIRGNSEQVRGLCDALQAENEIRKGYLNGSDIVFPLEDLKLGVKGDLKELSPGRRILLTLGGEGDSLFRYRAVILDAQSESLSFTYHCGVFLVPGTRSHEWLFSSEEGQWMVVESSKAARLIVILLDSSHSNVSKEEIQKDLSPLVKPLAPEKHDSGALIPFMIAGDGIKHRNIVHEKVEIAKIAEILALCIHYVLNKVTSKYSGPIVVEDVIYENVDEELASMCSLKEPMFRRLVFQRSAGLVQSEAFLIGGGSQMLNETERKKTDSNVKYLSNVDLDHTLLVGAYHIGIVAGFTLVSSYLERMASGGGKVETVVIGLGAGLLPMFLHRCMDFLHVEAVELDPVVFRLAKDYFGFCEDARLKVHVADGIQFLKNIASSSPLKSADSDGLEKALGATDHSKESFATRKLDIIIVDVDSSDSSSGLSCPAADFVEDSFFTTVRDVLSEQGLFIINLVSRSPSVKDMVISRMKEFFSHLFSLQLEQDVNEVVFAVNSTCVTGENISEAAIALEKLLNFENPERSQSIVNIAKGIKCLK